MSDHEFSLRAGYAPESDLRQTRDFERLERGNDEYRLLLGWHWHPFDLYGSEGGPLAEGELLITRGAEGDLGSRRNLYGFHLGWKQNVSLGPLHLFASPTVGIGYARNRLNFGRGVPLFLEESGNGFFHAEGGAGYCFQPTICLDASLAHFWERTLVGKPGYINKGWIFGLGLAVDLFPPELSIPGNQTERARIQAEAEETRRANQQLTADNQRLRDDNRRIETSLAQCLSAVAAPPPPCPACPSVPDNPYALAEFMANNPLLRIVEFNNTSDLLLVGESRFRRESPRIESPELEPVVEYLRIHRDVRIRVHGYANDSGQPDQNRVLSLKRAIAVRRYLVEQLGLGSPNLQTRIVVSGEFIDANGNHLNSREAMGRTDIVSAEGPSVHGEDTPLHSGNPAHTINRAVSFEVIQGGTP